MIEEMQKEALELDADAIIAADFKYNEISSGRSMLLMVGIGTAVKIKTTSAEDGRPEDGRPKDADPPE